MVAHERELIEDALAKSNDRIAGPWGAAKSLGIPRQTLESKIAASASTSIASERSKPANSLRARLNCLSLLALSRPTRNKLRLR